MSIVSDIEIRLRADIARLQQDMTAARGAVETATASMSRAVDRVKTAFAGLAAGVGVAQLARQVVDAQREFDKLNSALITATGSTANANKAFAALQNFAATTPFDLKQTVDAFLKLRNMGLDPSEKALRSYGNTAGALGKSLNQMIEAVADAATGEFERLKEFGIKASQNGDTVRLSFQGVTKSIGNNAAEIQKYLLSLGETKFAGGMELQAKTLDGAISNLGDSWQAFLRTISQSGFGDALNTGVRRLTDTLDGLGRQIREGGPVIEGLKLAAKLTAAYLAVMAAPAVLTAFSAGLSTVALNLSLIKLELANGIGLWGLFNTALNGTSVSAALAAGSLTKLQLSASLLFAAFAGWQIGKYLDENFYQARIAGEVFTGEMLKGWENIKYAATVAWEAIKSGFTTAISTIKGTFADFVSATATGLDKLGAKDTAKGIKDYAESLRDAAASGLAFSTKLALINAGHDQTIKLINEETSARVAAAAIQGQISEATREQQGNALQGLKMQAQTTTQALDWYKQTLKSSKDSYDQQAQQLILERELSGEEKKRIDVLNDLAVVGKTLGENDKATIRNYQNAIVYLSMINDARATEKKLREDANKEDAAEQARTASLREQANYYGLTEAAVLRLRAQEALRRAEWSGDTIEQVKLQHIADELNDQADIMDRINRMKADTSFWSDLESTAHQTFLSIADGGKNLATRLRDTLKNIFFDWLYQMTLKKWIIQAGVEVGGVGAVSGIAGATGATPSALSLAGAASTASSLYNAVTAGLNGLSGSVADAVQAALYKTGLSNNILSNGSFATGAGVAASTLAGYGLGSGLNSLISGQYQTGSGVQTIEKIGTVVASYFGGPLGGAVAGAVSGLINRAFGMGAKEIKSTSLQGTLSPEAATVSSVQDWFQKGGWFRSDKRGTDTTALDATQTAAFASTYKAILDVSKTLGDTIGADTAALSTRVQQLNIDLTGLSDATAQQKAITDFFAGVSDTIATELVPGLSAFQVKGEALSDTLRRVTADYAAVDAALGVIGKSFGAVGASSIAAREALVTAAGGIDKLTSGLSYFQQNFLTDAQKLAPVQKQVADFLASIGQAGITTVAQYSEYALGINVTTEAGAKLFAQLLEMAPAFKQVADASQAATEAAKAAADQAIANAKAAADATARAATDAAKTAFQALQSAVSTKKDDLQSAFNTQNSSFNTLIGGLNSNIQEMQNLVGSLRGSISGLTATLPGSQEAAARQLSELASSGIIPTANDLQNLISTATRDNASAYTTAFEAQRAKALTVNDLETISNNAQQQTVSLQQFIGAVQAQQAAAQKSFDAQVGQLDSIVSNGQAQLDALNGVNTSVLSLPAALGAFLSAAATAAGAQQSAAALGSTNWQTAAANAAGLGYKSNSQVFLDSAEVVEAMKKAMSGMQTAMAKTAESTQKLAAQFDQVSAGGNALLTEANGVVQVVNV